MECATELDVFNALQPGSPAGDCLRGLQSLGPSCSPPSETVNLLFSKNLTFLDSAPRPLGSQRGRLEVRSWLLTIGSWLPPKAQHLEMVLERPMSHWPIAKGKENHLVETMVFFHVWEFHLPSFPDFRWFVVFARLWSFLCWYSRLLGLDLGPSLRSISLHLSAWPWWQWGWRNHRRASKGDVHTRRRWGTQETASQNSVAFGDGPLQHLLHVEPTEIDLALSFVLLFKGYFRDPILRQRQHSSVWKLAVICSLGNALH